MPNGAYLFLELFRESFLAYSTTFLVMTEGISSGTFLSYDECCVWKHFDGEFGVSRQCHQIGFNVATHPDPTSAEKRNGKRFFIGSSFTVGFRRLLTNVNEQKKWRDGRDLDPQDR